VRIAASLVEPCDGNGSRRRDARGRRRDRPARGAPLAARQRPGRGVRGRRQRADRVVPDLVPRRLAPRGAGQDRAGAPVRAPDVRPDPELAPGEFDRVVEATGGESNAATWVDWTHYRLSLPAHELPLAIRLESERMHRLVLEAATVEPERDVVTNERRERVEDDVDGWLDEQLMATAFDVHPYRWPTIGWMADIRAVTLERHPRVLPDLVRAQQRDPGRRRRDRRGRPPARIVDAYGDLAPAALPDRADRADRAAAARPPLQGGAAADRQRSRAARLARGRPGHPDWAPLELTTTLLAGSPSARLHRRLVIDASWCRRSTSSSRRSAIRRCTGWR
jgi:hypothetical protein